MNANTQISGIINTVEQAIALLGQCSVISGIGDAVKYLEQRALRYQLLFLYSYYFPQQYSQSRASVYPNLEENEEWLKYTERELEFLQLVNDNLFPLGYLDYLLEEQMYFIEPSRILVTPLGMGQLEDYEMSYCDLAIGDRALLPMSILGRENLEHWQNHLGEDCYSEWFDAEFPSMPPMNEIAHPNNINYKKFRRLCFKAGAPVCYLPITLKLLEQNTNNIWLDEDGGWTQGRSGTTLDWSIENIDYLHREYLKARRILDAVGYLIDWLENDLTTNFLYIVRIWNQCTIRQ
ncbi:MAG: hypothetical protein QNJ72_43320 [Pleurocapsa sp. MO_226.B13]|nr:hypothetical protein [Pleurocapsa sp. MO_226.B13]